MRNVSRRTLALLLAFVMVFSFAAPVLAQSQNDAPGTPEGIPWEELSQVVKSDACPDYSFTIKFVDERGNAMDLTTWRWYEGCPWGVPAGYYPVDSDALEVVVNGKVLPNARFVEVGRGEIEVFPNVENNVIQALAADTVYTVRPTGEGIKALESVQDWEKVWAFSWFAYGTNYDLYDEEDLAKAVTDEDGCVIEEESNLTLVVDAPEWCLNVRSTRMDGNVRFYPVEKVPFQIVNLKTHVDGDSVYYTLDEDKQYIAKDVLLEGVTNEDGKWGLSEEVFENLVVDWVDNGVIRPGELLGVRVDPSWNGPNGLPKNEKIYVLNVWDIEGVDRYDLAWELPEVDPNFAYRLVCSNATIVFGQPSIDIPVYAYVDRYENETIEPVEGAVFGIYKVTNTSSTDQIVTEANPFATVTTDSMGYAEFTNIPSNVFLNTLGNLNVQVPYVVKQISAPERFYTSNYEYYVYVDLDASGNPALIVKDQYGKIQTGFGDGFEPDLAEDAFFQGRLLFPHFVGNVGRIWGADRFETAVEIAKATYPDGIPMAGDADRTRTVVIANGWNFPDALGGSPLTAFYDAPMLLTRQEKLPQVVVDYLEDEEVNHVVVLGGESSVSEAVVDELYDMDIEVVRVWGPSRYDTAVEAGRHMLKVLNDPNYTKFHYGFSREGTVFVTNGEVFADVLSVSVPARQFGIPILLTKADSLAPETAAALKEWNIKNVVIVGGTASVSDAVRNQIVALGIKVTRYDGANRQETAMKIAEVYYPQSNEVFIASDSIFADALAGSLIASKQQAPILLTGKDSVSPKVADYITENNITEITILGGPNTISDAVRLELDKIILENY